MTHKVFLTVSQFKLMKMIIKESWVHIGFEFLTLSYQEPIVETRRFSRRLPHLSVYPAHIYRRKTGEKNF